MYIRNMMRSILSKRGCQRGGLPLLLHPCLYNLQLHLEYPIFPDSTVPYSEVGIDRKDHSHMTGQTPRLGIMDLPSCFFSDLGAFNLASVIFRTFRPSRKQREPQVCLDLCLQILTQAQYHGSRGGSNNPAREETPTLTLMKFT